MEENDRKSMSGLEKNNEKKKDRKGRKDYEKIMKSKKFYNTQGKRVMIS